VKGENWGSREGRGGGDMKEERRGHKERKRKVEKERIRMCDNKGVKRRKKSAKGEKQGREREDG
jgi:hypothetical protein